LSWELSCRELDSRSLDVSGVLLLTTNRRNRKNNTLSLLFCFHPDLSSVLGVAYGWVEGLRLSKQIDCQISIRCASDCVPLYSESAKLYEKPCFVDVNGGHTNTAVVPWLPDAVECWVYAGRSLQRHHSSSRVYTDAVA
jgi:hypothetical protein